MSSLCSKRRYFVPKPAKYLDIQFANPQRRGLEWLVRTDDLGILGEQQTSEPLNKIVKGGHDATRKHEPHNRAPRIPANVHKIDSKDKVLDSAAVEAKTSLTSSSTGVNSTDQNWRYEVCLMVSIEGPGRRRGRVDLPYTELYRLFNAVKVVAKESEHREALKKGGVMLVATDSPSIVCKMVRDALGQSVFCSRIATIQGKNNQCKLMVVGETTKYSQQLSSDELNNSKRLYESIETVDLDAEDPAREPPSMPVSVWRPTLVTGFSSNHLEVGLLLLRSIGRAAIGQSSYNISVVVWTMDEFPQVVRKAFACVVEELQSLYQVPVEVRPFDFNAWPSWMRINQKRGYKGGRGEYAWKAIMIHTVLVERGFVYWVDAGDRFRSATALTHTLDNVKLKGFASRLSSGTVNDWCHVKHLQYLDANKPSILRLPNCDASGIGFTLQRYKQLARPWYECSITRQCIAPDGSSRANHRQDQSALTVLAALSGDKCVGVSSLVLKNMDSGRRSYLIGVNETSCYKDPLAVKWQ